MKKKGFTLIELLAVIIVLAVIAVIVTPIVTKTIKNAKKGSAEIAAQNYIRAVELAISNSDLNRKSIPDGEYSIDIDGNLTGASLPDGKLEIDASGDRPTGGTIVIKDGQVTTDSTITVGDYDVVYNPTSKSYEATEQYKGVLCKAVTTATVGNVPSGSFNYGDEYVCNLGDTDDTKNLTFFVLDKTETKVSLIMNNNLGDSVEWSNDTKNHRDDDESTQAVVAKSALAERTASWTTLNQSQIKLPSKAELTTAAGNMTFGFSQAMWIVTGNADYWTSTPYESSLYDAYYVAISNYNFLTDAVSKTISSVAIHGIRPVITISKSQLN